MKALGITQAAVKCSVKVFSEGEVKVGILFFFVDEKYLIQSNKKPVYVELCLTHAGDDAVHWQPGRGVIEASHRQTLAVLFFLLENKSRVLLLGDVDVVAGVSGGHDVARAGI